MFSLNLTAIINLPCNDIIACFSFLFRLWQFCSIFVYVGKQCTVPPSSALCCCSDFFYLLLQTFLLWMSTWRKALQIVIFKTKLWQECQMSANPWIPVHTGRLILFFRVTCLYSCWLDHNIAPPVFFSLASWFWRQP